MTSTKTLYLHIGQHKTGTSAIQSFFWRNRERLESEGVFYPDVGMSGPTHANLALSIPGKRDQVLAAMFDNAATDRDSTYETYSGECSDILYARLGQQIEHNSCPKIFLSSECFMEWIEPSKIKALLDQYCFCEVRVILFLRRQDLWAQSVFNQVVKDPGLRYAGKLTELPQMDMLDYQNTIRKWSETFGTDKILIKLYEETSTYKSGVLGYLAELLGLQRLSDYELPSFGERNLSLKRWQIDVLHELNRNDANLKLFQNVLKAFFLQNQNDEVSPGDINSIDYRQAKTLYRQYLRGNNKVAREIMGRKYLFKKPTKKEYSDQGVFDSGKIAAFLCQLKELSY